MTNVATDGPKFWQRTPACADVACDRAAIKLLKTTPTGAASKILAAVLARTDNLWDNGMTLNYSFVGGEISEQNRYNQQKKVKDTVIEWENHGNIKFNYTPQLDQAHIRISFDTTASSWSYIGKDNLSVPKNEPTMNLGWVFGETAESYGAERGVILHEFGHALGFVHEHPLTNDRLMPDAALQLYQTAPGQWDETSLDTEIIKVYELEQVTNFAQCDAESAMRFFMPAAMNDRDMKVIPPDQLSEMDKALMTILYPFPDSTPPLPESSAFSTSPSKEHIKFSAALALTSVSSSFSEFLVESFLKEDWVEIRHLFMRWCIEARVAHRLAAKPASGVQDGNSASFEENFCASQSDEEWLTPSAPSGVAHGVATGADFMWTPGDVITYSVADVDGSSPPTAYQLERLRQTFEELTTYANLTPARIPFNPSNPSQWIISFNEILEPTAQFFFTRKNPPTVGGRCKIGKKMINFGQRRTWKDRREYQGHPLSNCQLDVYACYPDPAPINGLPLADRTYRKTIEQMTYRHELCHGLGLLHEHASPNTQTSDDKEPYSVATPWDLDSIMMYGRHPIKVPAGSPAIFTKRNHELSEMDKAFLTVMYPRPEDHPRELDPLDLNQYTFTKSLRILGLNSHIASITFLRDRAFTRAKDDQARAFTEMRNEIQNMMNLRPQPSVVVPPPKARGVNGPPATTTTGSFLDQMVTTLSVIFKPTSGQMFALQFPGRFLQEDLYAWDTSTAGIYGQFVKPTVVNESEFRLVDQLYNVGSVIGAPSGINLSIVYEQVLNNLIPGIQPAQLNFSKQQGDIRRWLLKDVPTTGWVKDVISSQQSSSPTPSASVDASHTFTTKLSSAPSKPQFAVANKLSDDGEVNRMELAQALMHEYLAAKQAWELERDDMIKNAKGEDMDALTRRLAHITAIREAQLASKHADAVVRGYSHVIRQYMGYMDIKSPAEMLQDAKDALREASMSSLDGSMKIYPVQMQPIDWFQSLSTSFTMEDLTENPDVILFQIDSKSKQLDTLQTRLSILQNKPKTSVSDLQSQVDSAQSAYDRAATDISTVYTSNVISLAKTCINAKNEFVMKDFSAAASKMHVATMAFTNIEQNMKKLTDAQLSVTKASRALTQLMAQKSLAEATDTAQEIIETNIQITAINRDIQELTTRLQALKYQASTALAPPTDGSTTSPPTLGDIPNYPPETGSSGGSRWQEVYVKHQIDSKYTASSSSSTAATRSTNVSLFFGSYHSESSEASATAEESLQESSHEVEIGFRATLVTVDRGGWFQPQFFKQSAGFHSIDPSVTWSKWPTNIDSLSDITELARKTDGQADAAFEVLNQHLLPAFPVGFVICKDITIKIHMSNTEVEASSAEMEKHAASSSGILCWSTSSSSASKSSEKSYGFQRVADGCIIRIPGPQIMGYILQFTDPDTTTEIPEQLPEGFLLSDTDYDSSFADDSVAHLPESD